MAAIISKEDILKSIQAMSKDERLQLMGEIVALPEPSPSWDSMQVQSIEESNFDQEVMRLTRQFINKHRTLLHRLAE
jgi:hypothetical protein